MFTEQFYILSVFTILVFLYSFVTKDEGDKLLFSILSVGMLLATALSSMTLESIYIVGDTIVVQPIGNTGSAVLFGVLCVVPIINIYKVRMM